MHSGAGSTVPCHPSVPAQSLSLSCIIELLALGLLENPLECVVQLLNCYCVWSHWDAYKTVVGTLLCLQERKSCHPATHLPRRDVVRVEPPQISCKMYSLKPCFCITGWHRWQDSITTELS